MGEPREIISDLEYTLTLDCPSGCGGTIKLTHKAKQGEEHGIVIIWRGVSCSNLICVNNYSFEKSPEEMEKPWVH